MENQKDKKETVKTSDLFWIKLLAMFVMKRLTDDSDKVFKFLGIRPRGYYVTNCMFEQLCFYRTSLEDNSSAISYC